MYGCSTGSFATLEHTHFKLHRQLSEVSGVETRCQVKCSLSCLEDNVFKGCMEFDHKAAIFCTCQIHSKHLIYIRLCQEITFFYIAELGLLALQEAAQCLLYFSLTPSASLDLGAVASRVLAQVCQQGSCLLLIVPRWLTRVWFSELISLAVGSQWAIPIGRDLLP